MNAKIDHTDAIKVQHDYPLAPFTSWRIGGCAQYLIQPQSITDLSQFIKTLPTTIATTWLGLGSNVLIADEGVSGLVIHSRHLKNLILNDDETIYADAGVTCAKFARFCARNGFNDGAFFAGIPGTIGGALAMNAGAFGGETWDWVQKAHIMQTDGTLAVRESCDYDFGYRSVCLKGKPGLEKEAFVGAVFKFPKQQTTEGLDKIKELLRKRAQSQPIGTLNCGSVYRNPPGEYAAKLIEGCGLKGLTVGQACISEKHANFIINQGEASSKDIMQILQEIEATVLAKYQITLEREVRLIGNPMGKQGSV